MMLLPRHGSHDFPLRIRPERDSKDCNCGSFAWCGSPILTVSVTSDAHSTTPSTNDGSLYFARDRGPMKWVRITFMMMHGDATVMPSLMYTVLAGSANMALNDVITLIVFEPQCVPITLFSVVSEPYVHMRFRLTAAQIKAPASNPIHAADASRKFGVRDVK